jgi:hypothetical protein
MKFNIKDKEKYKPMKLNKVVLITDVWKKLYNLAIIS